MVNTSSRKKNTRIIINADDYGYFSCVSDGIIEASEKGVVTATGILANKDISALCPALKNSSALDAGVHLNLTYGSPISGEMSDALLKWDGQFPPLFRMAIAILTGAVKINVVEKEFRAQIEHCLVNNLELLFLNSHEHIHMLPPVYSLTVNLANEYNIPYVRHSNPEWIGQLSPGSLLRNSVFATLNILNSYKKPEKTPKLIGMSESGRLSISYFEKCFSNLNNNRVYELMCHPGHFDAAEITDQSLINYHGWEDELKVLMSDEFATLCDRNNISIIGYRDLQ